VLVARHLCSRSKDRSDRNAVASGTPTLAAMSELVHRERDDHVLVVSMRREAKRNAVDRALADALDDAFNELDDDPTLWVGVLTGTTTVFSAGSDLTAGGDYV